VSRPAKIPRKLAMVITANVTVRDVRQLMGEHGLELGLVQAAQDARGYTDHGVLLVATVANAFGMSTSAIATWAWACRPSRTSGRPPREAGGPARG